MTEQFSDNYRENEQDANTNEGGEVCCGTCGSGCECASAEKGDDAGVAAAASWTIPSADEGEFLEVEGDCGGVMMSGDDEVVGEVWSMGEVELEVANEMAGVTSGMAEAVSYETEVVKGEANSDLARLDGSGDLEGAEPDLAGVALMEPLEEEVVEDVAGADQEDEGGDTNVQLEEAKKLPRLKNPRVIALMNQKGGVGKTTTAVNLGAALARTGYRVLLLDLDPQAHLTLYLGIDPEGLEQSIYDLLVDDEVKAVDVRQEVEGYDKLDVLPAEVNLAGIESELADKVVTGAAQSVLRTKVRPIAKEYDFILLDCPPSLGLLTINALTLAKEVIVPMQAHFLALQGMGKLFETITMLRQGFNPNLLVAGIVLCMHEGQTILAGEVIGDLEAFLEGARGGDEPWSQAAIFDPPIRRNIKLAESPSFGQSIFDYDSGCNGAKDYMQLAQSVAKHELVWDI